MQTAYFNRFTLNLPDQCVEDCSHHGECDDDVSHWVKKEEIQIQFSQISPDDIRLELRGNGAWDSDELRDDKQNQKRILWIAACNTNDEMKLP